MKSRRPVKRILVRLPNWLGDGLLSRPLLAALGRMTPRPEVRAVGPAPLLELLAEGGAFDRADAWPAGAAARRRLLGEVRAWRADAALVLPPSFSSAWFAWRAGAAERVGYAHEGRSPLLTRALPRPPRGDLHLSEEYEALGHAVGAPAGAAPPAMAVSAPARARAGALLAARGIAAGTAYAVIGPGAVYGPAKRWPAERFRALAARLADRGIRVLVCGAASERATCEAVGEGRHTVLAGETDVATQAALCAGARVAVCNDSGLAHLAAAVGAPTVALFGSTSSAWTAPLGPRVRVVQHPPVCSPCFQRTCRIGTVCLTAIAVEEVWRACESVAA